MAKIELKLVLDVKNPQDFGEPDVETFEQLVERINKAAADEVIGHDMDGGTVVSAVATLLPE